MELDDLSPLTADAFVIQVGGAVVALTGEVLGGQIVVMLKGSDAGNVYEIKEWSNPFDNFGIDVGGGVEVGYAWHNKELEESPTIENFSEGDAYFVSGGLGVVAFSYQRSNVKGSDDPEEQWRWKSLAVAVEGGSPRLEFGIVTGKMKNSNPNIILGPCDREPPPRKKMKGYVFVGDAEVITEDGKKK